MDRERTLVPCTTPLAVVWVVYLLTMLRRMLFLFFFSIRSGRESRRRFSREGVRLKAGRKEGSCLVPLCGWVPLPSDVRGNCFFFGCAFVPLGSWDGVPSSGKPVRKKAGKKSRLVGKSVSESFSRIFFASKISFFCLLYTSDAADE